MKSNIGIVANAAFLLIVGVTVYFSSFSYLKTVDKRNEIIRSHFNKTSLWNISEEVQIRWPKSFLKCLDSDTNEIDSLYNSVNPAPHYSAIVQSIDYHRITKEFDSSTNLMNCYCKKFGCSAIINPIVSEKIANSSHFFVSRWISIRKRHWHKAEWIFGADTDLVPINFENNYQINIRKIEGRALVILHARRNHEVTASFVGFKTSDRFAQCFHHHWVSLGANPGPNSDNGDLLQLLLQIAAPNLYDKCTLMRAQNYDKFIECFSEIFGLFLKAETESPLNGGIGPYGVPIKIFMPLEGMWRSFEGQRPENGIVDGVQAHHHLLESDTFVHGFKHIGGFFGDNRDVYNCRLDRMNKLGPREIWWNSDQTLQLAKLCCFIKYRGCYRSNSSHIISDNICEKSKNCNDLYLGKIGTGLC